MAQGPDNESLRRYDLVNWNQGVRDGRFFIEGQGIRVEDGKTVVEKIGYAPEIGFHREQGALSASGSEAVTVYQKTT